MKMQAGERWDLQDSNPLRLDFSVLALLAIHPNYQTAANPLNSLAKPHPYLGTSHKNVDVADAFA